MCSGDMYWRFDDDENLVELDYPRDMSMWKGVPYHIDAVFQYTDKKTYFFKNRSFWEFDDIRMEVVKRTPTPVGEHWFHCPKHLYDPVTGSKSNLSSHKTVFILILSWVLLWRYKSHPSNSTLKNFKKRNIFQLFTLVTTSCKYETGSLVISNFV